MKKLRLILIEDNRLLREGITSILNKEPDINVIAAYGDSHFVVNKTGELKPDIILLDLGLSNNNSLDLVKSLKENYPEVNVIVMDLFPIHEDIIRFVKAGVSGFILKDATTAELTKTIRAVAGGDKVLPSTLAKSLFSQIMDYGIKELGTSKLIQSVRMTNREREIIELITEGLTNKEISFKLKISVYTVKSHVHNILEKMALNTRVQIAIHASAIKKSSEDDK